MLQIWQKVKSANPGMSVCEVGAMIGRMWREMSDINKQHFNDDFALDKVGRKLSLECYGKMCQTIHETSQLLSCCIIWDTATVLRLVM